MYDSGEYKPNSKSMKHSKKHYYDINRKFLSIVGQWPYQNPKKRLFLLAFLFVFLANALVTQIKALTDHLFADWDILETQEERNILKKYAENGRRLTLIYSSYLYATALLYTITSFTPCIMNVVFPLNSSRPLMLLWPAYYFVDEEKYYFYIFGNMALILLISITGIFAHDSTFFIYIEHVCGLFAVIGFRLKHLMYKRDIAKKNLIDYPSDVYHKHIVFSVHAHRIALHLVNLFENVFSISFGIQLIINTIMVSMSLLQISTHLYDIAEAIRYCIYIAAQLIHLFCFSFQGQKLINHSLGTRDKIYNGAWYEMPVKEQKLLLIIMRKSIEASTVTACKIYIFSLQSFTTVLQTAMSYFMVLASLKE